MSKLSSQPSLLKIISKDMVCFLTSLFLQNVNIRITYSNLFKILEDSDMYKLVLKSSK